MANVFLSYDHEDMSLARPIAAALEKAGHIVWYDRHIHGGAQYSRKIEQALDDADAVVVLWSPRSLDSAWVRDEAADGRDRGKLVPLSIGGITPPMGFRQFQTIDLGNWSGRGKVPHLNALLDGIESQVEESGSAPSAEATPSVRTQAPVRSRRPAVIAILALVLVAAIGVGAWRWIARGNLPVVEVAAADNSPRSRAGANDLFVKLGSLAQVGEGKWKLVDAASAPAKPTFVFRTADTGSPRQPQANLVLLDGKDDSLLWSRELTFPAGGEADLRQQMSLTAGRVLGCALETREAGGLPRDLFKQFLTACASMAEMSYADPETVVGPLRAIIKSRPRFEPAWRRLILADADVLGLFRQDPGRDAQARRELKSDMAKAERLFPDLPELATAKLLLISPTDYQQSLALVSTALERAPDNPILLRDQVQALQRVGRMWDGVLSARRAAEVDPLSPALTFNLIMALAYAGELDEARKELARAERLWAGTGALRDAEWSFHLRFGDPAIARKYAEGKDDVLELMFTARADPSAENIQKLATLVRQLETRLPVNVWGWMVQPLGEFGQNDDVFRWLARTPTNLLAEDAYILFRPSLDGVRKDRRFMAIANRIGLVDYWRSSGEWPDFCDDPALPYDCKAEAAKYAA